MAVEDYKAKKKGQGKKISEIGNVYGRLTVVSEGGRGSSGTIKWNCLCECGKTISVRGDCLRNGSTRSCKCLNNEIASSVFTTHGMSKTPTYTVFYNMKQRCYSKKSRHYDLYGGRGIIVCDRWLNSFKNFLADMGEKPKGMTIDRINNDGNYEPENCRWATQKEQARNTSRNVNLSVNGETKCRTDWAKDLGISHETLRSRINTLGWDSVKAMTTPVRVQHRKINEVQ